MICFNKKKFDFLNYYWNIILKEFVIKKKLSLYLKLIVDFFNVYLENE